MALIVLDPLPPCNETMLNNNQRETASPFYSIIYANEYYYTEVTQDYYILLQLPHVITFL